MDSPPTAFAIFLTFPCSRPTEFGGTLKRSVGPIQARPRAERLLAAGRQDAGQVLAERAVATPAMAAIQALVNQKTGEIWGNPNPIYYQIAQNQYGTAGGTFLGCGCNSSAGNPADALSMTSHRATSIWRANTTALRKKRHCYLPAGTYGVDSTDKSPPPR